MHPHILALYTMTDKRFFWLPREQEKRNFIIIRYRLLPIEHAYLYDLRIIPKLQNPCIMYNNKMKAC